jgi:hypothetical protein
MQARDLLAYRTPLIGGLVALTVGVTGGLLLRTGPQAAPSVDSYPTRDTQYAEAEPIAWPRGKVPDYVIGTDFLRAQRMDPPPVVVAAYEVPEYVAPIAWRAPEPRVVPQVEPMRRVEPSERTWASTGGDILDVRLPEDPPPAPEPPQAPVAVAAPVARVAASD